ncbi:MAG: hypothetical protein LC722_04850 [Actinobacteria bacterium]|nr:hypothetical protein [Actinomycetota bacterium]
MAHGFHDFIEHLDEACLVVTRRDHRMVFTWHGGHTVNIWMYDLIRLEHADAVTVFNRDAMSVGDFTQPTATEEDVRNGIELYLALDT